MIASRDIVAAARAYVGVKFVHQGRTHDGLDCLGLLLAVADDLGLQFSGKNAVDIDVPRYGVRPDVVMLRQTLERYLVPIAQEMVREADVVLLKIDGSPQHLALLTDYLVPGELGMVHAYAPARKVIEHRYDADWRKVTYAAFRLPQLL